MFRLRYLLFAVLLLAVVPRVLDGLPPLSCLVPTVDCLDESRVTVSNEVAPPPASAAYAVATKPAPAQGGDNFVSSPAAVKGAAPRPVVVPAPSAASTRETTASTGVGQVSFTAARGFGGMVTIKWRVPNEAGFDYYLLDRKLKANNDDTFERHIAQQPVDGSGEYSWTDTPASDTYTYRLRALASSDPDDAGKTLGTADVAVEYVVGLTVGNFALGSASGLVAVSWTAAQEGGVVSYVLDRKLEGAEGYDLNVEVGYPQGDGTAYSLFDDPHGTGTFIYRLRATLSNGTDRVLAEGGVTL